MIKLYHHGVLGMKWGVRRQKKASNKLNRALSTAFKAQDEYAKSKSVQTIKNSSKTNGTSSFIVFDQKKKKRYYDAMNFANKCMDELDRQGFDWKYTSNYSPSGKVGSGKAFVEVIVNNQKTRYEWD